MRNLNQIKLNHKYRYIDLCYMFGENPCDGNSRIAQLKNWSKHFEWHTEGKTTATRFIITKVYKQIKNLYEVEGLIFNTRKEAEEYARSL